MTDDSICNMFSNKRDEGILSNITIRGEGKAILDGGVHNGLYEVNGIARTVSKYPEHSCSDNCTIRNNIVAKTDYIASLGRAELHTGIVAEYNIFVTENPVAYEYTEENGFVCMLQGNHNIHFNPKGEHKLLNWVDRNGNKNSYTIEEAADRFGLEEDSVVLNPMFKDYDNDDYTLLENSSVFELGFEKIDTSDVGITI